MVGRQSGRASMHPGPSRQQSSQLLRKPYRAPDPPTIVTAHVQNGAREVSPMRNNILLDGPVFAANQRPKRGHLKRYVDTIHPPERKKSYDKENRSRPSSRYSSRRPSLSSLGSYGSSTATSVTKRRTKRRAPPPPSDAIAEVHAPPVPPKLFDEPLGPVGDEVPPEWESSAPLKEPPPEAPPPPPPPPPPPAPPPAPPPPPPIIPPIDYELPPPKPKRVIPEPEPDRFELLKAELMIKAAERASRGPIKIPARPKYKGSHRMSQALVDELKTAYTARNRRRSKAFMKMREGGLSKLYKAKVPPSVVPDIAEETDNEDTVEDDDRDSSDGSIEMVDWVPSDDIQDDFELGEDAMSSEFTSRSANMPTYFHIFTENASDAGSASPKAKKRNNLKTAVSSVLGTLTKTLGRRNKVKNLLEQGWEIYHTPQTDALPSRTVNMDHLERRSAYAYHPAQDKLMVIPNYDRVVVTDDGQRIREDIVPNPMKPKKSRQEILVPIKLSDYDVEQRKRRIEMERMAIQNSEAEFKHVRQRRRRNRSVGNEPPGLAAVQETRPYKSEAVTSDMHASMLKDLRLKKSSRVSFATGASLVTTMQPPDTIYSEDEDGDEEVDGETVLSDTTEEEEEEAEAEEASKSSEKSEDSGFRTGESTPLSSPPDSVTSPLTVTTSPPMMSPYGVPIYSMPNMMMYPAMTPMAHPYMMHPGMMGTWPAAAMMNPVMYPPGMINMGLNGATMMNVNGSDMSGLTSQASVPPASTSSSSIPSAMTASPMSSPSPTRSTPSPAPVIEPPTAPSPPPMPPVAPPVQAVGLLAPTPILAQAPAPPPAPPPPPIPTQISALAPVQAPPPPPPPPPPPVAEPPPASPPPSVPDNLPSPPSYQSVAKGPRPWSPINLDETDEERRKRLLMGPIGFRPIHFNPNVKVKSVTIPSRSREEDKPEDLSPPEVESQPDTSSNMETVSPPAAEVESALATPEAVEAAVPVPEAELTPQPSTD